jgi:hypothetical protein
MSGLTFVTSQRLASRVASSVLGVLLLTSVHHAYGAYVYNTPWRLHVVFVSVSVAAAIFGSLYALRRWPATVTGETAFWGFAVVTLLFPVVGIGLFEGGYNHAVKDALYLAGASGALMHRLFPPSAYELPNDLFFEVTGVLQLVPGIVTGYLLYLFVKRRKRDPESHVTCGTSRPGQYPPKNGAATRLTW